TEPTTSRPGSIDADGETDRGERGADEHGGPGHEEPEGQQLRPAQAAGRHTGRRRHQPSAALVLGVDETARDDGQQQGCGEGETGAHPHEQRVPGRGAGAVEVGVEHGRVEADAGDDGEEHGDEEDDVQMPHLGELVDDDGVHSPPPAVRPMKTDSSVCSSRRTPWTPIPSATRPVTMPAVASSLSTSATRTVASSRRAPWARASMDCARRGSEQSMSRSGVAALKSSARVPWKINRPWLRMPSTVAVLSTSPSRCEETMTVTPPSA